MNIYVHHHGELNYDGINCYNGGIVDVIPKFDTDLLSFRDLLEFARDYKYDLNSLVYYQYDGHSFAEGVMLLYDDDSVRCMVTKCEAYGEIHLFVDHSGLDPLINAKFSKTQSTNAREEENFDEGDSYSEGDDEKNDHDHESYQNSEFRESDFDSEDIWSECDSSEDENMKTGYVGHPVKKKKRIKSKIYKPNNTERIKLSIGMQFVTMEEFRMVMRDYALKERRAIIFVTNDPVRCQVKCENGCPFHVWVTKLQDSGAVEIRALRDDHLCTKPYKNRLASVKYLTDIYGERLRKNPQWKIKDMIDTVREDLEIEVPRIKILRVRKAALEGIHDKLKDMYSRIWDFGAEILKTNPLNKVSIETTRLNEGDPNKFKRIYISYHSLKYGWKIGCRPLIGLDGCFLKTVTGGQLLSAVGRDGNNQMLPLAYAVVEGENASSWRWFINLLKDDLELGDGTGYSIISDQQKGLKLAVSEHLPHVEHRFCARHIYSNFRKKFPSTLLRRAFWSAACAPYPVAHQRAMKQIERISKPAHDALKLFDPSCWSKAYFQTTSQADNVENNLSECFNAWILDQRYQPLLTMLQEIHFKLMCRMKEKKEEMQSRDWQICPQIKKKLDTAVSASRNWHATWDGQKRFVVKHGTKAVTVNLEERSCDCRMYDLTGIPCAHAVAAIHDRRMQPLHFVSHYYTREKYLQTYELALEALRGEDYWEVQEFETILPPDVPTKLRGRPKKLRRKESWEENSRGSQAASNSTQLPTMQRLPTQRKMHCSICKNPNHKRPKCPMRPVNENEFELNHGSENFTAENATNDGGATVRQKLPVRRNERQ